ncbi:MAG: T9SS type A sorting domain-containing protein [Taibaiella sp.]|nr:T9SS type A sorting domain-containing protein [Taibaiella sp.]
MKQKLTILGKYSITSATKSTVVAFAGNVIYAMRPLSKLLTVTFCLLLCTVLPVMAATYTVTNTNDAGTGSLRQAIINANATALVADNIVFNITGTGPHTITLSSELPVISSPVNINGYTQPGSVQAPIGATRSIRIEINGGGFSSIEISPSGSGSSVSGLAIYNGSLGGNGIRIQMNSSDVHIWGNYIGILANGTLPPTGSEIKGNLIEINTTVGSIQPYTLSNITIGTNGDGTNDANEGNVIGNSTASTGGDGIEIATNDGGTTGRITASNIKISGNYIGLRPDGSSTAQIGASGASAGGDGGSGVTMFRVNGTNFVIGSNGDGTSDALERNVIANCRSYGIILENSRGVDIAGNYIGTDATGTLSRATGTIGTTSNSWVAVYVTQIADFVDEADLAQNVVIGFDDTKHSAAVAPFVRNVISGNHGRAVGIATSNPATNPSSRTKNVVVAGNYIGVDVTGNTALPNGQAGPTSAITTGAGVAIISSINNRIGTDSDGDDDALERNVISGNSNGAGIYFSSGTFASEGNVVAGNYIGVGADGTTALGNGHAGVYFSHTRGINNNRIGANDDGVRDDIEANIIANNGGNVNATLKSGISFAKAAGATGTATGNRFSRNIYYNNASLSIDLMADATTVGVTPNDGAITTGEVNLLLDYPVITSFSLSGTTMTVTGYVSNCNGNEMTAGAAISGNKTIQFYKVADDGNQNGALTSGCSRVVPHGEGVQYLGAITGVSNSFNTTFTLVAGATFTASDKITAVAIDANGNTSEFGALANVTITGTVYNDVNGGTNIDGSTINTATGAPTLYASLYQGTTLVATVPVSTTNGTYSFTDAAQAGVAYNVVLGTNATANPTSPFTGAGSGGWITVGEDCCDNIGNDGSADGALSVTPTFAGAANANFGIKQPFGYIYVHKKALSEEESIAFPFTITAGPTTVPSFNLNDLNTLNSVLDLGASQDGTLWATGENSARAYYRLPNSSLWVQHPTITTANRIDGGPGNTAVMVNNQGASATTNGYAYLVTTAGATLLSPAQGWQDIASDWKGHIYGIFNDILYMYPRGATGSQTWIRLSAATDCQDVDADPVTGDAIVRRANGNIYRYVPPALPTVPTQTNTTVINLGNAGVSMNRDVAVTANGTIFGSTQDFVYEYSGSGTSWLAGETTSRKYASRMTGGLGNLVWGTTNELNVSDNSKNIYTRIKSATEILWLNDERIRLSSEGNGILIPVAPGTYTVSELVPAGWDLTNIQLFDPTTNSSFDLVGNNATINVVDGETVGVVFENTKVNPFVMSSDCNSRYIETFGTTATAATPLAGQTSYHYMNGGVSFSNQYIVSNVNTDLFPGATNFADHTPSDVNGRAMVVDANNEQDAFFRRRFTNVIPGATYAFTAWVANINPGATIKPNVTFEVIDPNTYTVLQSATSGDILTATWQQFGIPSFTAASSSFDLVIRNNAPGGSGNDLSLDDIEFKLLPPADPITTVVHSDCNQSSGSITVSTPVGSSYEYRLSSGAWQTSPLFSGLIPGSYTVFARYVGSNNCIVSKLDTVKASVCGKVLMDGNGLEDNTVNGAVYNQSTPLYAVLYNNTTGKVDSVVTVTSGEYSFLATPGSAYTIYLTSSNAVTIGQTAVPVTVLPDGFSNTGEVIGTSTGSDGTANGIIAVGTVTQSNNNVNFGINKVPDSDPKTYILPVQPVGNTSISLSGGAGNAPLMSGLDNEDGTYNGNLGENRSPQGVRISSLPTNGQLWYNGVQVTSADLNTTIFTNPSLFSVVLTGSGYTSMSFQYAYVDAARAGDPTPATYTISWGQPLPVAFLFFDAVISGKHVALEWATGREQQNKGFYIQRSADGFTWKNIGFQSSLAAGGNSSSRLDYHFVDAVPLIGKHFYRLLQTDYDGKQRAGDVRMVTFAHNHSSGLKIYPNPVSGVMTIEGLSGNATLRVLDLSGRLVLETQHNASKVTLDLSQLLDGIYHLQVISGTATSVEKFIKLKN